MEELSGRGAVVIGGGSGVGRSIALALGAEVARLATAELGKVHLLVNTVGVLYSASVLGTDEQIWGWFIEFHLMATIRVVDTFVPLLREHGEGGHVVITSSAGGLFTLPPGLAGGTDLGVYTTLKFGLLGYGETLRHELAGERIGVSVLCPGALGTSLSRTSARNRPERFGGPLPYTVPANVQREPACGHQEP